MKVFEDKNSIAIVLEKGEKIIDSLKKLVSERKIFGYFKGIGAVKWAEIAYGDAETGQYLTEKYEDGYEILGINGNITLDENEDPIIHAHILLGDRDHKVIGGHLVEAEVSITCEIFLTKTELKLKRKRLGDTSFKVIDSTI